MEFLYAETTIAAVITFIFMLAAYKLSHMRKFHVTTMIGCIIFDICMPIYLVLNRDWYGRMIEGGEILNFLVWMHIGLVITLYILYIMQVKIGRELLRGEKTNKESHAFQARGILLTRAFVIMTGALLYEAPESTVDS